MRVFVIANGVIENVIEAGPGFALPGKTLVPAGSMSASPGWGWDGSAPIQPAPPPAPALTRIPKDFIWRRATDEEAVVMRQLLASQSVRKQEIYNGANYVSVNDEFYPDLLAALTVAFGEARALELLEPTE